MELVGVDKHPLPGLQEKLRFRGGDLDFPLVEHKQFHLMVPVRWDLRGDILVDIPAIGMAGEQGAADCRSIRLASTCKEHCASGIHHNPFLIICRFSYSIWRFLKRNKGLFAL